MILSVVGRKMDEEIIPEAETPEPRIAPLAVLAETQDFVVINKPSGLLSIPDRYGVDLPNAERQLRKKYGEIFVVHRLDKDTSGVMVFARTAESHKILSKAFEERAVQKVYLAIVDGCPAQLEGKIEAAIGEDSSRAGKMKIDENKGKSSITTYKVVEKFRRFSLLELKPETGRQHQIRVHCAMLGHPLTVDPLYGKRKEFLLSEFKRGYKGKENERPIMGRLSLHSSILTFPEIHSGQVISFQAPMPKDMNATIKQLRQNDSL